MYCKLVYTFYLRSFHLWSKLGKHKRIFSQYIPCSMSRCSGRGLWRKDSDLKEMCRKNHHLTLSSLLTIRQYVGRYLAYPSKFSRGNSHLSVVITASVNQPILHASLVCVSSPAGRGGGGEALTKILYREAPPQSPTPYRFIYHFSRYPFCIPSIDKWYPFYIRCLELYNPFNCCKCTVF